MPLATGQVLNNRYRIVKLLGQGGMGAVYRAWDLNLEVPRAIKENLDTSPAAEKQFTSEAKMLAKLRHPNLPLVHDHFIIPGQGQYLVMDFVEGEDLQTKLDGISPSPRSAGLPEAQVLPWILQVCQGLEYLHAQTPPIIHRDIKPANIRITPQGRAVLVDFGIAKAYNPTRSTTTGARAVTPGYSPLEQYGQGGTDARSDVYSLGATLYTLLTGITPPSPVDVVARIAAPPLPVEQINPQVSFGVCKAVKQAMEIYPDERIASAGEFAAALKSEAKQPVAAATPPSLAGMIKPTPAPAPPAPKGAAGNRWLRNGLLIAVGIALLAIAYFAGRGSNGFGLAPKETPVPTMAPLPTEPPAPTREPLPTEPPVIAKNYLEMAYSGEFKGATVVINGPGSIGSPDEFDESVQDFEARTGIDIQYIGDENFEAAITERVAAGEPPDIAVFSTPYLLEQIARQGALVDVREFLPIDYLERQYKPSWLEMATMQGPQGPMMAGVWALANGKSMVWYPKSAFEAAGYEVPNTWDELMALTEQIARDGSAPWCIGIESGAATGWVVTDWIEDVMLRTTSAENYDRWVKGELKFDSPEVRQAIEIISMIWFNDAYVFGGRRSIAVTHFGDSPDPMFENPPRCWLHRQGSFIPLFFPEGLEYGVDYDFFYLPPIDAYYDRPLLILGDIYAMFNDRPEVRAVMQYYTTAESARPWIATGDLLSPHNDQDLDWYSNPLSRKSADLLMTAGTLRFDGSDQMPAAVGAGSFWKMMTAYINGEIDLDAALREIDASWPR